MNFAPKVLIHRESGRRVMLSGCRPSSSRPARSRRYGADRLDADALPPKVDLRPSMNRVEDQADSNSCTANAIAGAYEFLLRDHDDAPNDVSRLFIYFNARAIDSDDIADQGSSIVSAIDALSEYGACDETTWPYDLGEINTEPPGDAYDQATALTLDEAQEVAVDLRAMKHCLAEGYPFVFGLSLFGSFDEAARNGRVPDPSDDDDARESHGLHAMLAVGYSDKSQCFVVRNSWGESWGDAGYCYIPYSYMTQPSLCFDLWTIRTLTDAGPYEDAWSDEDDGFYDPDDDSFEGDDAYGDDFETVDYDDWGPAELFDSVVSWLIGDEEHEGDWEEDGDYEDDYEDDFVEDDEDFEDADYEDGYEDEGDEEGDFDDDFVDDDFVEEDEDDEDDGW